ncbi:MAG: HAMP domain-containing sensor histidine kinase [Eubacteriales bacterium]|nr:HAMP domain-containing sensor histidine kinase [Eubacteriales bacterium]
MKKGTRFTLNLCKVLALTGAVSIAAVGFASTSVTVTSFGERNSYHIDQTDWEADSYADTKMFSNLYGNSLENMIRYCTIGEQMETDGVLDENKPIDVAAYVYRDDSEISTEDMPTAVYYLKDLLRWERLGFSDTERYMTREEAADFFSTRNNVVTIRFADEPQQEGAGQTADVSGAQNEESAQGSVVQDEAAAQESGVQDEASAQMSGAQNEAAVQESGAQDEAAAQESVETDGRELAVAAESGNGGTLYGDGELYGGYYAENMGDAVSEAQSAETEEVYYVWKNRFQTVDGRNIENCVDSYEEYQQLTQMIEQAAQELAYNYEEYTEAQKYFAPTRTNFRYAVFATDANGAQQVYTNMELQEQGGQSAEQAVQDMMRSYGSYLFYAPDSMSYETNTLLSEKTVSQILDNYQYAFPDNLRIYTAVDTEFPVEDEYRQAEAVFDSDTPQYTRYLVLAAIFLVCYVIVLAVLIRAERRARELTALDHVPLEIVIILAAVYLSMLTAILAGGGMFYVATAGSEDMAVTVTRESIGGSALNAMTKVLYPVFFGSLTFFSDLFLGMTFFTLLRRIQAHVLWQETILRRIVEGVRNGAWRFYDNSGTAARVWIPYLLFLLINIALMVWWLPLALVFDLAVGLILHRMQRDRNAIVQEMERIAGGDLNHQIDHTRFHGDNIRLAKSVNRIGSGIRVAVETSTKDEKLKADLITNVSHDIKTPLTSIINYVGLLKREHIENPKIAGYIDILDQKSQRLKQLTDDLVEASKISSGNITLQIERINFVELINQALGEFSEKLSARSLTVVLRTERPSMYVGADSRQMWRVVENLLGNAAKYAAQGSRIYIDMECRGETAVATIKNVSEQQLNISADELTERFIRGDISRSTEGSGLGLSIAKNLMQLMGGGFEVVLDGDLFKVILSFPLLEEKKPQPQPEKNPQAEKHSQTERNPQAEPFDENDPTQLERRRQTAGQETREQPEK